MRIVAASFLVLCFGQGLFAQLHGVRGSLGSVVYPAGAPGTPGVTRTGSSVVNPGGGGVHLVSPIVPRNNGARKSTIYAYPVYVGGYYTPYVTPMDPSAGSAPVQPNVTVVMPPQQASPVIINNYYPSTAPAGPDQVQPVVDEVSQPTPEPTHYLIAFTDHTIYAATAYWVDGDTLHYFTSGNTHNQASLSLVDRAFTERLNKESGVEVKLPAPAK
jgi:hypothetical protein